MKKTKLFTWRMALQNAAGSLGHVEHFRVELLSYQVA